MDYLSARPDEALIASFIAGNEKAFHELIGRYIAVIYNYAFRFVGNSDDAEDVTQETFLKLWRHVNRFSPSRGEGSFKPWLFRIAHNVAIDHLRKRKDVPLSFFDQENGNILADTIPDTEEILPDELFAQEESKEMLYVALEKIPLPHREVLMLHYQNELSFEEIGAIVGKSLNTVKSQHRRALLALRRLIDHSDAPKQMN